MLADFSRTFGLARIVTAHGACRMTAYIASVVAEGNEDDEGNEDRNVLEDEGNEDEDEVS